MTWFKKNTMYEISLKNKNIQYFLKYKSDSILGTLLCY